MYRGWKSYANGGTHKVGLDTRHHINVLVGLSLLALHKRLAIDQKLIAIVLTFSALFADAYRTMAVVTGL